MSSTLINLAFASNDAGFGAGTVTLTGDTLVTAWDSVTGNPAGSLKGTCSNSVGSGSGYAEIDFAWTDFGVPSGAVLSSIAFSIDDTTNFTSSTATLGPYALYNSSGTLLYTFITSRAVTNSHSGYITRTNTVTVTGSGTDSVKLRLYCTIPGPSILHWDNLTMTVFYTVSGTSINNNFDLFISGISNANSNFDLFTEGFQTINGTIDLYTEGFSPVNQNITLYERGYSTINGSPDLFVYGQHGVNGGVDLEIMGNTIATNNRTLFTEGFLPANNSQNLLIRGNWDTSPDGGCDLFIYGVPYSTEVGVQNLYINGSSGININNSFPIFLHGDLPTPINNQTNLYINGPLSIVFSIPLFINSNFIHNTTNLFINSSVITDHSSYLNLYLDAIPRYFHYSAITMIVNGSTAPGFFTDRDLYISGGSNTVLFNLYTAGKDTGGTSQIFNLWLDGVAHNNSFGMFLQNTQSEIDYFTWMYTAGEGFTGLANNVNSNINLYLERGPNAGMCLFMNNKQIASGQNLMTHGFDIITNNTNLYVGGFILSQNTDLFIDGEVPQDLSGNINLGIPKINDIIRPKSLLYTHGFNYNL